MYSVQYSYSFMLKIKCYPLIRLKICDKTRITCWCYFGIFSPLHHRRLIRSLLWPHSLFLGAEVRRESLVGQHGKRHARTPQGIERGGDQLPITRPGKSVSCQFLLIMPACDTTDTCLPKRGFHIDRTHISQTSIIEWVSAPLVRIDNRLTRPSNFSAKCFKKIWRQCSTN